MKKKAAKTHTSAYSRSQMRTAWLFLLPNFVGFMVFIVYPVIKSFVISFYDWDGLTAKRFVGLGNYIRLFQDGTFQISFLNNIHYTLVTVPLSILLGILIACLMNVKIRGIKLFRTIYFLPQVTSMIAIGIVWTTILANYGPINQFLMKLGIQNPPMWLSSSTFALISVEIVSIWRSMGYNAIIFLAGLQGISGDLYEAARIDGANRINCFFKITVPMLSPTIFLCTVMQFISSLQVFDTIMAMTQGGPGRATNVLTYYIYQRAFVDMRFGYASAVAYTFAGIGKSTSSGSQLVSTVATTGMPNFLASAIAIFSFLGSTTKRAPGILGISLIPPRYFSNLSIS